MAIEELFQLAGVAICGTVLAWVGIGLAASVQQLVYSRRRFELSQELLRQQVAASVKKATLAQQAGWDGWRKFRIKWKSREAQDCYSFYLVPHDGKPLPKFQPGQYLTLKLKWPNTSRHLVRCYSLSDRPRDDYYRLTIKTVKHADGTRGSASHYLNELAQEGDLLDVANPKGPFHLDVHQDRPIVLLGAGIGITPLMSMLNTVVAENAQRDVWLFYGVRNGCEHLFRERLLAIRNEHPQIRICVCYSQPQPTDVIERDYDVRGRVTLELLKDRLPSSNFHYYLCGPSGLTTDLLAGLLSWRVPEAAIHFEAFGPASPKQLTSPATQPKASTVTFAKSGCRVAWTGQQTLLDLAESQGVNIEFGCRTGSCGTCLTAIKSGRVQHLETPGANVPPGSCLPCVAVPDGPLVLDT